MTKVMMTTTTVATMITVTIVVIRMMLMRMKMFEFFFPSHLLGGDIVSMLTHRPYISTQTLEDD